MASLFDSGWYSFDEELSEEISKSLKKAIVKGTGLPSELLGTSDQELEINQFEEDSFLE